jgi:hypothetical protein
MTELLTVDPRTLKLNPENPRTVPAAPHLNAESFNRPSSANVMVC